MQSSTVGDSGTIASWTPTDLIKFVQDQQKNSPVLEYEQITVDDLYVLHKLTLTDLIEFTKNINYTVVGLTAGAPAFLNSWTHFGSPYHNAAFWKDPLGFVHLRGVVKSGVVGSAAFTLPPGYRPPGEIAHLVLSNGTTGRVDIQADGSVIPKTPSSNLSVSLDNFVPFKVA